MPREKSLADHISDWFRILIKEGITGLLVGLGFVLVLFGGLWYGGSNSPPAGFWSMTIIGAMMILLGVFLSYKGRKTRRIRG
jgi:Mg/Co/Ni transporter MgtE